MPNCFVFANETQESDAKKRTNENGDEIIWLEEKISPTTTWIEGLFKPLTVWIEQQINEPDTESAKDETSFQLENRSKDVPKNSESRPITDESQIISDEQAITRANQYIEGEVLYLKLIPSSGLYRVKLLSNSGEIHVFYIDAISGDVLLRDNNRGTGNTKSPTDGSGSSSNRLEEVE